MENEKQSSPFFLIFITIAAIAFAGIPPVMRAFDKASDNYIIDSMNLVQSEMYFYEFDHGHFQHACIGGDFVILTNKILLESGSGVSCTTSPDKRSISLYTRLKSGDIYCVDSNDFGGIVSDDINPNGYCSK